MELQSVIAALKLCVDGFCSFTYFRNTMGMSHLKIRGYFLNLCVLEVKHEKERRVKSCNYRE